jgi:hypothetical protein
VVERWKRRRKNNCREIRVEEEGGEGAGGEDEK